MNKIKTNKSKIKKYKQYDKFLHEIQKTKMEELWDNKKDNF
ncbi:MAG: hypothetical protein PHF86_07955 [Candidatus Nanoarchaeia archaeon]|nr:hypothetical protein [Candidatus Nanoarchaeia archaeon]